MFLPNLADRDTCNYWLLLNELLNPIMHSLFHHWYTLFHRGSYVLIGHLGLTHILKYWQTEDLFSGTLVILFQNTAFVLINGCQQPKMIKIPIRQ